MIRRVLITAGANGIGLVMARAFAARGDQVWVTDVDAAMIGALPPGIRGTVCDAALERAMDLLFAELTAEWGGLDVLVANAGIKGPTAGIEDMPLEAWHQCLGVNLDGAMLAARGAARLMKPAGKGAMVFLSSTSGLYGTPFRAPSAYCVAFLICYSYAEPIYGFLVAPLSEALHGDRRMIYTGLTEAFYTYLKVGAFAGFFLSFPDIAIQISGFVPLGFTRTSRQAFLPFLIATPVLFISGAALLYYGVMPMLIGFFLGFETTGGQGQVPIQLEARVSEYLGLIMQLILAFGMALSYPFC